MGSSVDVAVEPLQGAAFVQSVPPTSFKQSVDRADAQCRDVRLIATDAQALLYHGILIPMRSAEDFS